MKEHLDPAVIGELLGLIAHDLRNPLSALHSNLGFLRVTVVDADPDAREAVEDGLVSCDGLAHIIDNVDLLAQTLRGVAPTGRDHVDLPALIAEVVGGSRAMAQSHGVELTLGTLPATGVVAQGAREPLASALANLVRNSIQHSPMGGNVHVSFRAEEARLVVLIEDSGAALSGKAREMAFTAAGQIDAKSLPSGRYSRGLGLYCAALAAAAGRAQVNVLERPSGNAFELVVTRKP